MRVELWNTKQNLKNMQRNDTKNVNLRKNTEKQFEFYHDLLFVGNYFPVFLRRFKRSLILFIKIQLLNKEGNTNSFESKPALCEYIQPQNL